MRKASRIHKVKTKTNKNKTYGKRDIEKRDENFQAPGWLSW